MTQLLDLDDDCLLEVFNRLSTEQLFKMLSLNKRLNQLATEKIRNRISAIAISEFKNLFSDCLHLDAELINRDQVLFLWPMFKYEFMFYPSSRAQFISLLSKCSRVKSIDFNNSVMRGDVLLEVVKRCPELECIKLINVNIKKEDWDKILNKIGNQLVHLVKKKHCGDNHWTVDQPIEMIADKCPNLKRIDWSKNGYPLRNLLTGFKHLPRSCWITLNCDTIEKEFARVSREEDVAIDELTVETFNWSLINGRRFSRLSSLKFNISEQRIGGGSIRGVDFANLRKFNIIDCCNSIDKFIGYLLASRFPRLEEFSFFVNDYNDQDYQAIFRQFVSVRKLIIDWQWPKNIDSLVSAICLLINLEAIYLLVNEDVVCDTNCNEFDKCFQCLKYFFQSLDEISSLKKLTVEVEEASNFGQPKNEHFVIDEVRRMKANEQNGYEINLIIKV